MVWSLRIQGSGCRGVGFRVGSSESAVLERGSSTQKKRNFQGLLKLVAQYTSVIIHIVWGFRVQGFRGRSTESAGLGGISHPLENGVGILIQAPLRQARPKRLPHF